MRDADERPKSAFQSIQDALKKAGFDKPDEPLKPCGYEPKITVMILPDIETRGALESLLLRTVEDKEEIKCVDGFIDCLKENNLNDYSISSA
jgi:hypothetical protein